MTYTVSSGTLNSSIQYHVANIPWTHAQKRPREIWGFGE